MSISRSEEIIAVLWFILATQLKPGLLRDTCNACGAISLIGAIIISIIGLFN